MILLRFLLTPCYYKSTPSHYSHDKLLLPGEYGATMVLRQMAEMARLPAYEMLTWKKLFTAIIEYCIRWVTPDRSYGSNGGYRVTHHPS